MERMSNYVFNIYKSLTPEPVSSYELLQEGIVGFQYEYHIPYDRNSSVHEYFRVEAENLSNGQKLMSSVFGSAYTVPPDDIAEAIIYQEEYLLDYILNRPVCKLLIKRRTGTKCSSCWDEELKQTKKSQCTECFGTSYEGGYGDVQDMKISFTEPAFLSKMDIGDVKDIQQNVTMAWAKRYPLILPGDVLIDEFNRRFRILQVMPTTKDGRIYLRQNLQVQLIPPSDIIYKFNVNGGTP